MILMMPHSLTSSENEFLMQHFFLMFCAFFRGTYFSITVLIYSISMRLKQSVCIIGFSNPPPQRSSAVKPYLGWRRLPNWSALPLYKPSRNFQFENRKGLKLSQDWNSENRKRLNLWHFWPTFVGHQLHLQDTNWGSGQQQPYKCHQFVTKNPLIVL